MGNMFDRVVLVEEVKLPRLVKLAKLHREFDCQAVNDNGVFVSDVGDCEVAIRGDCGCSDWNAE